MHLLASVDSAYEVLVLNGIQDAIDDNVDVEVRFTDGRRFSATFITVANVKALLRRFQDTGECAHGSYFWAADMIVVPELSLDLVCRTVADLIEQEHFEQAFARLD